MMRSLIATLLVGCWCSEIVAFKIGEAGLESQSPVATDELVLELEEWPLHVLVELEDEQQQLDSTLIDWHTDNLVFFLEKLVPTQPRMNETVAPQIREFVTRIAALYHAENPYQNFEHATHVTHAIRELLLAPMSSSSTPSHSMKIIRSDPLIAFSLVFSALVHDVDHDGVPNAQLIAEDSPLAKRYQNQSIAERNSIDLALHLWSQFRVLRQLVEPFQDDWEYLVSKAILATDIASPTLRLERQARWQAVYGEGAKPDSAAGDDDDDDEEYLDAPTLIALEHCMQVADVAHTMQESSTNHLWNERLLAEWHRAFQVGRAEKDPLDGWYLGELGFFDFYVLPLAKKWEKCCGINATGTAIRSSSMEEDLGKKQILFGSTSLVEEAQRNREEWIEIGHGVVEELVARYR